MMLPRFYIRPCGDKGLGVFAAQNYTRDDVIECCRLITFTEQECGLIATTNLNNYLFDYGELGGAIALGNGSLYNHSSTPNAEAKREGQWLIFRAIKSIQRGDEITHDYQWPTSEQPDWYRHEQEAS